jgi:2,4-dienoyl-CoA reductase-like NADH-dependent reductase (Old Yellow Enzyme family)
LNSRIIRTGLWNTEKFNDLYKRYEEIASSGVGLIITEIMALHTKDKFSEYAFKIDHPNFVGECKQLAKISHKYNVPIFGQVEFVKYNRGIDLDIDINDLTIDDIRKIQTDLIIAAKKLSFADFDGIQLALGNNFYLSKFINPYYNQRDDEYGGNTYNRMKIVLETIKVIKK